MIIRNPYGEIGSNLKEDLKRRNKIDLISKFDFTQNLFLSPRELENYYNNGRIRSLRYDGIFFISAEYFFDFFTDIEQSYIMPYCNIIEYSIKLNKKINNINKRYFYFHMKVKELSLVQFNLSTEVYDKENRIENDYYKPEIKIINNNNNEISDNEVIKLIKEGDYLIEWYYYNKAPEDKILF